ncbi:innexin inx2-like [Argiope bruennichi]|uniref:innexin inx2-like n=1 Tax=Argiope bruennichi TaxID=94029 RepID=UPI00249443DB|nr:innexin inx2-like [Argiope bruennichi]
MGRSIFNNMLFSYKSPTVDNFVFWLVHRFTAVKLLIMSLIITCRLAFGDSFTCSASYDALPQSFMDAKCYSELIVSYPGSPNPVIQDRGYSSRNFANDDTKREQPFYQWVNLALLVHAVIFHLPHLLWKAYESGYIGRLTAGLEVALSKEQKRNLELCYLAKFLLITQGKHKVYTGVFIFFEVCNFIVCISQTVWLVSFFNMNDAPNYLSVDTSTYSGYRNYYFPSTSLCSITKYSASGEPRNMDAVCVLSLNDLYMRLFLFLRAWYIILILATGAVLIYRLVLIQPKVRSLMIRTVTPLVSKSTVMSVCHQMSYCDWFFLMAVQKELTNADFSKLIEKMFAVSQNTGKEHEETDDKSSIYEDSHKELELSPRSTPL